MPTGWFSLDYTTDGTWDTWNRNYTIQTYSTSTSSSVQLWSDWNRNYTSRTTSRTNVWLEWNRDPQVIHLGNVGPYRAPIRISNPHPVPLVRSEADWEAIRAENDRLRKERDLLQKTARAEARKLLAIVLTPTQMDTYLRNHYFDVVGSEGGHYRLHHGTSGNIRRLIDGQEVNMLCVHPELYVPGNEEQQGGYLPTEDSLAAQALAIMHDERGAVLRANVHRGERHLRAVA